MSSSVAKKLQYIQQMFLFLIVMVFRDRCTTNTKILLISIPISFPPKDRPFFPTKFLGLLKKVLIS